MIRQPGSDDSTPTPEELRARVEGTREELGMEVEEAAGKTADVKEQAQAKAAEVLERTPQPVREKAYQVGESARTNVKPLVGFGLAVLAVCVVVSRAGRR
ncbi:MULTISPECIES: DUF3618 domain-containing protein [Streptomyces]|uniref:DUF3618 domain-containing protein n=1 Tax=Streptomyces fungicidicus TaxID=68203 RepID=A0ACC7XT30_9ACTN|nr:MULTISPECIES: DUF3618 domain-containing protein [Streptomyces]MBF4132971.1 DUF3618 domain-containing protein [Streptomyces albidoflavus]NUV72721.1 DUF3618 domain-containing protein [Streptomyces fungicidicus]PAX85379.1 hypothetical protein CLM81_13180 [Streptomyces albidoflavus]PAX89996.1 hypothetical protein CLM82_17965 [Streptomyces albidoflavus]PBO16988.1 hypothetical protein CLM83_20705 [Streptomyces albidoflavus]